ncbi:hypothetical protein JCM6882_002250 [Rhodosporidiobolus microsporus]
MIPTERIAEEQLGAGHEEHAWMNASYGLTAGLFVLLGGRLGDKFSAKYTFLVGYFLLAVFNLGLGFTTSPIPFDVLRAFTGVGSAFLMPNSVALLARQYPSGMKRTVAFACLGALAPIGFMTHAVLASLVAEKLDTRWIFWLEAVASAILGLLASVIIPQDENDPSISIDGVGNVVGLAGLILFNFAWNQGPLVGWETAYVPVTLAIGVVLLGLFFFWERRQGDKALLPTKIFTKPVVGVCIALWWGWMSLGTWLYYTTLFIRDIRGYHQPLAICAQMIAITPPGILAAVCVIWLNHNVKGHYTLAISMACFCIGNILLGTTPPDQSLWPMLFPAEIIVVFGPDLSFAASALIIANSVPPRMAGIAGGLVNLITNYAMSIGLGLAGTVERYTKANEDDLLQGYRSAFWFAACAAFAGLVLVLAFVRVEGVEGEGREEKDAVPQAIKGGMEQV